MSIHYGKNIKTRYFKGYINNFTTVGTPTFDGSVVSGFSTSNYLLLNPFYKSTDNAEYVFKFRTSSSYTAHQVIIHAEYFLTIELETNGNVWAQNWEAGAKNVFFNASTNTDYWVKVTINGTTKTCSYSTDGVNFIGEITFTDSKIQPNNTSYQFRFGLSSYNGSYPFLGSIDLLECYAKINNELWWQPYKRCKYDYNFNVTGTPSISNAPNCEVSGFSTSNYLSLPEVVPLATADSWEKVVKVTHKVSSGVQAFLTTSNDSGGSEDNFGINNNRAFFRCSVSSNSALFEILGTTTLVDGAVYWLKIEFTGDTYNLYLSTTGEFNGEETLEGSRSSTTKCLSRKHYIGNTLIGNYNYIPTGSIDLTQSYIKINGELWWSCFKQSDEYVFTKEATKEDYDYTVFEDGKIGRFYRGDLYRINYYKYTYEDWTQPVLTSNTSHGTVSSTNYNSSHPPYIAFDGVKANGTNKYLSQTTGTGDITWRTPEPIKIKSCELYTTTEGGYLKRFPQTITVYGSDNGVDWIEIGNLSGYEQPASGGFVTVPCNASKAYAYSKWEFTGSTYVGVSEIVISAQKQIGVVESTADDYDFTKPYKGEIILGYKGETLVYSIYPDGVVFEENTAGTYTISPAISGPYEISLVGPGSGGTAAGDQPKYADKSRGAGGGSGAYVKGIWNLTRGVDYTIVVGAGGPAGPTTSNNGYSQAAGDSSFGDIIVCGGGGATAVWKGSGIGGAGGTVKTCENPIQLITRTAGNQGSAGGGYTYYAGGESKLPPHGAGGFGQATGNYAGKSSAGENGYCKVRMLTIEPEQQKINVNFVGNVKFDNGVVSGFSDSNYLTLQENFDVSNSSVWEKVFKFTTGSDVSTSQAIIGCHVDNRGHVVQINGGKFKLYLSSGTSWDIASNVGGTYTVLANTTYYIKFEFTGSAYNLYYSLNGVDYILDITINNSKTLSQDLMRIGETAGSSQYFLGSIDLFESYMKINGELYWKGIKRLIPHTFTINAMPDNAIVIINGEERNSLTALEDSKITWSVSLDKYKTQSGTLTLTEDTVLDVVLEEVFYLDWTQPVLTSDTSHGELTTSGYRDIWKPWYAFDGKIGTNKYLGPVEGGYIVWQTPEAIKIKSCKVYTTTETDQLNRFPNTITIYGSDDGVDWVEIGSLSGYKQPASGESVTIPCNATKPYAYSKWEFSTGFGDVYYGIAVSEIEINAVYIGETE